MKINIDEDLNHWEASSVRDSEISSRHKPGNKGYVKSLLSNLPKPSNNYEIDIMDSVEPLKNEDEDQNAELIEDEEDRIKKANIEKARKEMEEFLNQTQVVQKKLVRPIEINENYTPYDIRSLVENINKYTNIEISDEDDLRIVAETQIKNEMLRLLQNDLINYPLKGSKVILLLNKYRVKILTMKWILKLIHKTKN